MPPRRQVERILARVITTAACATARPPRTARVFQPMASSAVTGVASSPSSSPLRGPDRVSAPSIKHRDHDDDTAAAYVDQVFRPVAAPSGMDIVEPPEQVLGLPLQHANGISRMQAGCATPPAPANRRRARGCRCDPH